MRKILIFAYEPHGPNGVGGFEWRLSGESDLAQFLFWCGQMIHDQVEDGHNRFYFMCALVDASLSEDQVTEALSDAQPWLDTGYHHEMMHEIHPDRDSAAKMPIHFEGMDGMRTFSFAKRSEA